jgi:hypothetical protein
MMMQDVTMTRKRKRTSKYLIRVFFRVVTGWATPPWCVGPLWPPSNSSSDLWKLSGKIRLQELVSSNSENISCVALLKHKNSRKQGTGTVATC